MDLQSHYTDQDFKPVRVIETLQVRSQKTQLVYSGWFYTVALGGKNVSTALQTISEGTKLPVHISICVQVLLSDGR